MFAIFKKEFKSLFFSPGFYLSLVALQLMCLYGFQSSFSTWASSVLLPLCLFIIGTGAGLISKEFKEKTFKLLFSAPIKSSSIIFGKYLALFSVMFIEVFVLFLINFVINISFGASFLMSDVVFSLFALGCFTALFSAITLLFSSITKNVGLVCTLLYSGFSLTMFGFVYLSRYGFRGKWFMQVYSLIFDYRRPFEKLLLQIFSLDAIGYFIVIISACFVLSFKYLENKR